MIDYASDQAALTQLGESLTASYAENKPWPHIVIDDFIACLYALAINHVIYWGGTALGIGH